MISLCALLISSTATTAPDLSLVRFEPVVYRARGSLQDKAVRAFMRTFDAATSEGFGLRNWRLVPAKARKVGVDAFGESCQDAGCYEVVAKGLSASHWLSVRLMEVRGAGCGAVATLFDAVQNKQIKRAEDIVSNCSEAALRELGQDVGEAISFGPKAPISPNLGLTPTPVPNVDIPDIPNVLPYGTRTASRSKSQMDLGRSLRAYQKKHLLVFEDKEDPSRFYVSQGSRLLNECELRILANTLISPRQWEHCRGNSWEWAWLGVPAGAVIALGSTRAMLDRETAGVFGFSFGALAAVVTASLALLLNRDAAPASSGEHVSPKWVLESLVQRTNEKLRRELELSNAEVYLSGMRL